MLLSQTRGSSKWKRLPDSPLRGREELDSPSLLPLKEPALPRDLGPGGEPPTFTLLRTGASTGDPISPNKFLSKKLSGPGK